MWIFPLSCISGDILTGIYGYAQARRVIWIGFFGNLPKGNYYDRLTDFNP